jgi:hypothetical protein
MRTHYGYMIFLVENIYYYSVIQVNREYAIAFFYQVNYAMQQSNLSDHAGSQTRKQSIINFKKMQS